MPVCGRLGQRAKLLRRGLEIPGKPRAKIGNGTARKEEGYRQGLTVKLAQRDGLAEFVGECAIQQRELVRSSDNSLITPHVRERWNRSGGCPSDALDPTFIVA